MNEYKINGIAKVIITQKKFFSNKTKEKTNEIPFIEWVYADSEQEALNKNTEIETVFNGGFYKPTICRFTGWCHNGRVLLNGGTYKRVVLVHSVSIERKVEKVTSINSWSVQKCRERLTPKEFVQHIGREELMT